MRLYLVKMTVTTGEYFHTFTSSSSLPSPSEWEPFPDSLLVFPFCILWMELLAMCISLSSLLKIWFLKMRLKQLHLYSFGLMFTVKTSIGGIQMIQVLFGKSWFLVFCLLSFPSFPLRISVKLYPAVSLNHCSLQVDCVLNTRFPVCPLFSS